MPRLSYLLLADEVTKTSGKTNIIGVFTRIQCRRLPSNHPKMALTGQVLDLEKGKHDLEVRFLDTDLRDYLPPIAVTLESDGLAPAEFVVNIQNFPVVEFRPQCKFVSIEVRMRGDVLGSADLELRKE